MTRVAQGLFFYRGDIKVKPFKSYNEQIKTLEGRGVNIGRGSKTKRRKVKKILIEENYYSLINGYKDLFLASTNPEKYKKDTDFFEIYALYNFDRNLRNILLKKILKIENKLKAVIAYTFSKEYGNDYLNIKNYDVKFKKDPTFPTKYKGSGGIEENNKKLDATCSLINYLTRAISDNVLKKQYLDHSLFEHESVPLWVLVNILTMGTISKFYKQMKKTDRINVSKNFNLLEETLGKYIYLITLFRNICAHEERCYSEKVRAQIADSSHHVRLNLLKNTTGNYLQGKNDIFALLITMRELLSKKDYTILIRKLDEIVIELNSELKTISISDVLDKMGFPANWKDL